MEEKEATNIPKASSRLPLPRSGIPTPAASASTSTTTARSRQTPAARSIAPPPGPTTPSRSRIGASATLPKSYKSRVASAGSQPTAKEPGRANVTATSDGTFIKPPIPRRQPSSQFSQGTRPSTANSAGHHQSSNAPLSTGRRVTRQVSAEPLTSATKSAPSLTERTIETLSNLPSSPAKQRPQSKGDVASRSGSRPASSNRSDESSWTTSGLSGRPDSSSSALEKGQGNPRASTCKLPMASVQGTPSKRMSAFGPLTTPRAKPTPSLNHRPSLNKVASRASLAPSTGPRTPSPDGDTPVSKFGTKTLASRPLKARGSIHGLFDKPNGPPLEASSSILDAPPTTLTPKPSASSKLRKTAGVAKPSIAPATSASQSPEEPSSAKKSSSALRDQIAKAKAAKRAAAQLAPTLESSDVPNSPVIQTNDGFGFESVDDPFGQKKFEDSNREVLPGRIDMARMSGRLNIAAMGLKEIPSEVLKMYDLESIGRSDGAWAESVDLTRFVAADNELQSIDDTIFPDIDPNNHDMDEEEVTKCIFWGLESIDLHGNMLTSLPLGLRRLQQLTSLNLASNKLANESLALIAECIHLRDLKLNNNLLSGTMADSFILDNLEILDLHGNNISALPSDIEKMKKLRILNLDENAFEALPFQSLATLPLSELHVRKNKLAGTLIESGVECFPQLQILDCSGNQLTHLVSPDASQPLRLPSLHQLTVSMNRLKSLPDMSGWDSILTINADDNTISAFPEGFTSRHTLRHAGFSGNDIRIIPPEIARMEGLTMLAITGNPLRDKKFTSLATEELKDALLTRLEPLPSEEAGSMENFATGIYSTGAPTTHNEAPTPSAPTGHHEDEDESEDFATPPTSAPQSPVHGRAQPASSQPWAVKMGGILDRSNTESSSLHPVECSKLVAAQSVREVRLQHNTFTQFPNSLSFFSDTLTSLSLSHNQLTGESWLTEQLDLGALRELNLQSNFCTSLTPLMTYLCAPNLEKLDVSLNRIVQLPALREVFPNLTVLLIANNRLEELDPEKIQGMKIVDASNNEIAHLNPRIGLLGLDRLDVLGNRFRVPRWNVLERGTEATLRWLRGRVPVAEMAEWRAKGGVHEDDSGSEVD